MDNHSSFLQETYAAIAAQDLIKLSLGNYQGKELDLKNIYIKLVVIKKVWKMQFTFRYRTKDIAKNYELSEGKELLKYYLSKQNFRVATLFTADKNLSCQLNKNGEWFLKSDKPTAKKPASFDHDKAKERKLQHDNKYYLQALRLTDSEGKVFKNAQDKWKQINHYIEILSSMLQQLPQKDLLKVVDMGAGKGYLTFALYDFLCYSMQRNVAVVGVEYRQDLVDLCNKVAKESQFDQLIFEQGTIDSYSGKDTDVLIALHACDTATDDAIAKGIKSNAELIVVAPCCHKQIRREMERERTVNEFDFLVRHGIFMERQAEMLTDGMRALIMEYFGYQTKVFQFIADAHTPKNVLVMGIKKAIDPKKQQEILAKIRSSKTYFGIGYHHLERLMGIENLL